jgi:predicted transcriptional regulator
MNKPNELPLPTPAELTLLQILWECGPSSVREVHTALGRDVAYTSVLKQLQNMHGKKLVTRQDDARAHVYEAAEPRDRVERRAVSDLAARLFGGSPGAVTAESSSAELEQLRRLLDAEGEGIP